MHKAYTVLFLVVLLVDSVSAYNSVCNFNGSVNVSKADLVAYTQDQIGCGIQHISSGIDILIIAFFVLLGLVILYGMWRKAR